MNHTMMFGESSVIPRGAHCLFLHGKNDPVLDNGYIGSFVSDLQQYQHANVQEVHFQKARHAMSVVEHPEEYKLAHVNHLLAMVHEWRADGGVGLVMTHQSVRPPIVHANGEASAASSAL